MRTLFDHSQLKLEKNLHQTLSTHLRSMLRLQKAVRGVGMIVYLMCYLVKTR